MIKTITMYYVECDNCKESLFENEDYSCYNDENLATEIANEIDGCIIDHEGKDYCLNCAHFDDEDNLIINTNRLK